MLRSNRFTLFAAIGILAIAMLGGCRQDVQVTSIKTLLDDPARYDKQTVRVAGEVTQSMGLLGYGAYRLSDGTGTIAVVAKGGGAPRTGAKVGVEGEFRSAFTLGTESAAVILEHARYTP